MKLKLIAILSVTALVLFVAGYFFAARIMFPPLPEPENGIVVPSLTGLSVEAARARLAGLGLRVTDIIELSHPTQAAGTIIAQSPLAGQQLRNMGAVRLGISAGPAAETTPPSPEPYPPLPAPVTAPADSVASLDSIPFVR